MSGRTRISVVLDLVPAMLLLGVVVFAEIVTENWSDLVCPASQPWTFGALCDVAAPAEEQVLPERFEPLGLEDSSLVPAPATPTGTQAGADAASAAP